MVDGSLYLQALLKALVSRWQVRLLNVLANLIDLVKIKSNIFIVL